MYNRQVKEISPEKLRETNNPVLLRLANEIEKRNNKIDIGMCSSYYSRMHSRHNRG